MPDSEILKAALEYRNVYGFSILPINPQDKKPLVAWLPYQQEKASEEVIRGWWKKFPLSMVGIITGKLSGVMVLDGDSDDSIKKIESLLPDGFITVSCTTPRGQHWYFKYRDGVRNSAESMGFDVRGEGGYVVAPPSVKLDGKTYSWVLPPEDIPIEEAPPLVVAALFGKEDEVKNEEDQSKQPTFEGSIFEQGNRDKGLFFSACSLLRGGMPLVNAREIIYRMARSCTPPFPEKEAEIKIQSALKATGKGEGGRPWLQEIEDYVSITDGIFHVRDLYSCLAANSVEDKGRVRATLERLRERKLIEKTGNRDGQWRRIDLNDVQIMNWREAPTTTFNIKLPLHLNNHVKLYPGNIAIVAGSKSGGKTAFMLNTVLLNMGMNGYKAEDIVYLNSEMGETEMKNRLILFEPEVHLDSWMFTPIARGTNWSDLITPEKKIFIIDYMEITDDFYKIAEEIRLVHNKLKEGVCFIALQKDPNATFGRGGTFSAEKARLYLTLDHHVAKMVDVKAYRGNNPRGWIFTYKLLNGSFFIPHPPNSGWHDPEEEVIEDERAGKD